VRGAGFLACLAIAACAAEPAPRTAGQPLAIRLEPDGDSSRLVLTAAPGWKIGARLKPALETDEGLVFRFDAARLTPDSAYFAEPPIAIAPGRPSMVHGTLRASACAAGERVCRVVVVRLRTKSVNGKR
jgi:hypothetical protein